MVSHGTSMLRTVERQYATQGDLPFRRILDDFGVEDDDESLAELIEADGRARLTLGKHVDLARYLEAVPGLEEREVPLDAAIDVTLRSLSAASRPTAEAVETLVANYPHLEDSIREAAALAEALWSTTGLRARLESPPRTLPSDFGPRLPDGRRRYELRRLLGKGGWGEVYLAADRQLSDAGHEALVAIKVLSGRDRGPWARQRLIDEATKARRVVHRHVVRVLDRGVSDDDEDFIVYEHVEGGDLGEWLQDRRLTAREAALLMAKIARGVQAAHAAGLVHCDLKPGNVLMTREDEPRVADFGIAVRSGEGIDAIREHADGRPVGNIAFISPEQFRMEEGSLSAASDIYALGGMLYYLVSRRFPNGASLEEVARTHDPVEGRTAPPSLRGTARGVNADLDAICRRAMAVRPEDRYPSAAAFADDLEAWVRREPILWTKPGPGRMLWLTCRRHPAAAVGVLLAVGAVMTASASAYKWSRIAAQKAAEATLTLEQIETGRRHLLEYPRKVREWTRSGFTQDVTPISLALEWMGTSAVFGDPMDPQERWRSRIEVVELLLKNRAMAGLEKSVEALAWETNLGLWYLNAGRNDDAERILASNAAKWRAAVTDLRDPWIALVERLHAVAVVRRHMANAAKRALTDSELAELRAASDVLEPALEVSRESDGGTAQQLFLVALLEANAPGMLARAKLYNEVLGRIRDWEREHPSVNPNSNTARALREARERRNRPRVEADAGEPAMVTRPSGP